MTQPFGAPLTSFHQMNRKINAISFQLLPSTTGISSANLVVNLSRRVCENQFHRALREAKVHSEVAARHR